MLEFYTAITNMPSLNHLFSFSSQIVLESRLVLKKPGQISGYFAAMDLLSKVKKGHWLELSKLYNCC